LEPLQGIPGTVGAALRMNAGGKYGAIASHVRRVYGFERDGSPFKLTPAECGFAYRGSNLGERLVIGCELELEPGDPAAGRQRLLDILKEKCRSQPVKARSAGCVFKNPSQPGAPPAGKLIDESGLKGCRVGGASVSLLHANFLVCGSGATASDVARLIQLVRQRVFEDSGIKLDLEIETWGFAEGELLPPEWVRAA
jgi:UDP-N-acetylmuramate dehydrogenase